MFSSYEITLYFLLPAMIVAAGFAIGLRKDGGERSARAAGAIAFSLGFAAGFCSIGGIPHWPPGSGDAAFWLVWFSIPTALLGSLDAMARPPLWLRFPFAFGLFWFGLHLLLGPLKLGWTETGLSFECRLCALGAVGALWWLGLETEAEHLRGPLMPVILAITTLGAALVLGVTQNLKLAAGTTSLVAMTSAAAFMAYLFPRLSLGRGAIFAIVSPLFGMLVFAQFYAYTTPPLVSDIMLLAAPLLARLGDLPALPRRRGQTVRAASPRGRGRRNRGRAGGPVSSI